MNPFQAFKERQRSDLKEMNERERECAQAVSALLRTYNCQIKAYLRANESGIYADAAIEALPKASETPNEAANTDKPGNASEDR